ncbi:nitroreductase/quinone reductase family protein [Streptomyces specialis]|uniref:nitroreductase/quinone reductase family protein n=1 Tax=Streptomyces specialis TaxID=498367 RepID=UPI00073E5E2A|nr:nitroreductase/quinone reductase family protein [Streptomyces specialis]
MADTMTPAPDTAAPTQPLSISDLELNTNPFIKAFIKFNVYMYSKPPRKGQLAFSKLGLKMHIALYKASKGKIMGKFGDLDGMLITTLGRKSGLRRTVPVGYIYDKGHFYSMAAPGHFDVPGGPKGKHPGWFVNLRANPEATINIGPEIIEVVGEELRGEERDAMWERFCEVFPFMRYFQSRSSRLIPVVRLTPKDMLTAKEM